MPNARSTALLSASLSVTAPAGSSTPLGISDRRRLARQQAAAVVGEAGEHGGGLGETHRRGQHGMRAASRISRPRRTWRDGRTRRRCTGLSVLAAAAAIASAARCARARDRGQQDRQLVDARVGQHDVERAGEQRHVVEDAGGDIGRIVGRAERGDHLAQGGERRVGELRQASGRRARPRRRTRCPSRPRSTARRRHCPCGRRPGANSLAMSTIGSTSSTSMRPDWRMAAR